MGLEPASRSLTDELLLLAPDARRKHLRVALRAAAHAEGERTSLGRASRSLVRRGLAVRTGWRTWAPTREADVEALQAYVSRVLWRPRQATARDLDLVTVLLVAGALSGRQRMHARSMLARVDAAGAPRGIAWLLKRYALSTTTELADKFLHATAPRRTFEDGAFDPGESLGV